MAIIYLFRHGQSEFNLSKTFTGWLDSQLTPLGVEQAKALGQMLKDKKLMSLTPVDFPGLLILSMKFLNFIPNVKTLLPTTV